LAKISAKAVMLSDTYNSPKILSDTRTPDITEKKFTEKNWRTEKNYGKIMEQKYKLAASAPTSH
jgi:hypothetical protein